MLPLQEVFIRVQAAKKQKKDLETAYKDALKTSLEYQEIDEKLKTLRERKKQIEATIREQFSGELTKIEDLKIDIASDVEMMSDIAMTQLMKGETVEVKDEYENSYEPVFKVNFKKTK
jgi:predicted  nucleic acid-binding Zn-ribbon protein